MDNVLAFVPNSQHRLTQNTPNVDPNVNLLSLNGAQITFTR